MLLSAANRADRRENLGQASRWMMHKLLHNVAGMAVKEDKHNNNNNNNNSVASTGSSTLMPVMQTYDLHVLRHLLFLVHVL